MASTADKRHRPHGAHLSHFLHAASTNISYFLGPQSPSPPRTPSKIHLPLLLPASSLSLVSSSESPSSTREKYPPSSSSLKVGPSSETGSGLPPTVRISTGKDGGPAFVGQVFSMCDLSGTGLMAVSTHFDIPFLSKRTPEWLKKMFAAVTRSERNGPVFRFFMDLGDAVSYVKQLNIPSGVVGACRLDVAYEHFKEKPHLFQFVPNERQVKEANKLMKTLPHNDGKKKVEGVPVFGAQNLDIAIATKDGIKWYTPYFFDKNMLDNILEDSADQHFQSLIETRHSQRRGDDVDDSLTTEAVEDMVNMMDPSEVQELLDQVSRSGLPLSIMSKVAEIQLSYAVDRVLLGNRWLRKATGIQPKFPYMVDSFERRSRTSFLRAKSTPPSHLLCNSEFGGEGQPQSPATLEVKRNGKSRDEQGRVPSFQFPFRDWFTHPFQKLHKNQQNLLDKRDGDSTRQHRGQEVKSSPFLPKITMVGISTGEPGKMSKTTLKKKMDDLTRDLEKADQVNQTDSTTSREHMVDERDPLFVANVGDYYPGASKAGSARWVR